MRAIDRVVLFVHWLLGALVVGSVLLVFEQLTEGRALFSYVLRSAPVLIAFPVGVWAAPRVKQAPLFAASVALPGLVTLLLLRPHGASGVFYVLLTCGAAALLFYFGLRGLQRFPVRYPLMGLGVLLIGMIFLRLHGNSAAQIEPLAWWAFAELIVMLFAMNLGGLRDALHNIKGQHEMALPRGIQAKNLLLTLGFLVIALAVAFLPPLRALLNYIVDGILWLLRRLFMLIGNLGGDTPGPPPAQPRETPDPGPAHPNPVVTGYLSTMVVLAIIAVLAVLAGGVMVKNRKRISAFFRRRRRHSEEDYHDEIERITTLREALRKRAAAMRERLAAMRRREHFDDMETPERRLRFAYKSLLKKRPQRAHTPLELSAEQPGPALQALGPAYSALKYGETSPEDDALARRAMDEIKKLPDKKPDREKRGRKKK